MALLQLAILLDVMEVVSPQPQLYSSSSQLHNTYNASERKYLINVCVFNRLRAGKGGRLWGVERKDRWWMMHAHTLHTHAHALATTRLPNTVHLHVWLSVLTLDRLLAGLINSDGAS